MKRELTKKVEDVESIPFALNWVRQMLINALQAGPVMLRISKPTRTLSQNNKMWPMLGDIAKQVNWHGFKLADYEWKDVFTAALKKQKVVPGIDGGFVVIGAHTSKMKVGELSDLIELIYAFGAEHDVKWSENNPGNV